MKAFLAINQEQLEQYISNKIENVDVVKVARLKKNLVQECEALKPDFIIISNALPGNEDITEIIDKLSTSKEFSGRIIYLYGEDDAARKSFINYLIARGVYDYQVGEEINPDIIRRLIFEPRTRNDVKHDILKQEVIEDYKVQGDSEVSKVLATSTFEDDKKPKLSVPVPKPKTQIKFIEKVVVRTIKQQVLTFFTTDNNIDKDDILTQIAVLLAKKSKQKILVIDMNSINPTLDHFFGIGKEAPINDLYDSEYDTGLKMVYGAIEKDIFAADFLNEIVVKHKQYSNLHILTGLYDMNLFDSLDTTHYELLIDKAKDIYDTIIINTNPAIFTAATYVALTKATNILLTTNCNYTCARNVNFMINYLIDYHKMLKGKFKIICNNMSKASLNEDAMAKIFEDYEVLGYIPFNINRELYINKQKPFITSVYAKKDLIKYVEIIEKLGYIPKISLMDKVFKKKQIIEDITEKEDEICQG